MPADKIFIVDRAENMHLKCVSTGSFRESHLSAAEEKNGFPPPLCSQHPLFTESLLAAANFYLFGAAVF